MKLLVNHNDEMVVAQPDDSNYVYVMNPHFVHMIHVLDGSQLVVSNIQFQTLLHQAMVARRLGVEK